jgi:hypothetical protein
MELMISKGGPTRGRADGEGSGTHLFVGGLGEEDMVEVVLLAATRTITHRPLKLSIKITGSSTLYFEEHPMVEARGCGV